MTTTVGHLDLESVMYLDVILRLQLLLDFTMNLLLDIMKAIVVK